MGLPRGNVPSDEEDPRHAIVDTPKGLQGDVATANYEDDPLDEFATLFTRHLLESVAKGSVDISHVNGPSAELCHLLSTLREWRTSNPRTMRPLASSLSRCLNQAIQDTCPGSSTDVIALITVRAGILPVAAFNVTLPAGLVFLRALAFWSGAKQAIPTDTADNFRQLAVILLSLGLLLKRVARLAHGYMPDLVKGLLPTLNGCRMEIVLGPDLLHLRPKPSLRSPASRPRAICSGVKLLDIGEDPSDSSEAEEELRGHIDAHLSGTQGRELGTFLQMPKAAKARSEQSIRSPAGKVTYPLSGLSSMPTLVSNHGRPPSELAKTKHMRAPTLTQPKEVKSEFHQHVLGQKTFGRPS